MVVVGIDGSTKSSGLSIMVDGNLEFYTLIEHKEKDAMQRIRLMLNDIYNVLDKYDADIVCMEKAFNKQNIDTLQKLSYLCGGIIGYCVLHNIAFENPTPSTWRSKVGIPINEGKRKIKREVLKELAIQAVENEYNIEVNDDVAESILLARSKFDLSKLEISEEDLWI